MPQNNFSALQINSDIFSCDCNECEVNFIHQLCGKCGKHQKKVCKKGDMEVKNMTYILFLT